MNEGEIEKIDTNQNTRIHSSAAGQTTAYPLEQSIAVETKE